MPAGTAPPVGTRPSHGRGAATVRTHRDLGYEVPVLVLEVVVGGVHDRHGNAGGEKDVGAGSLAFVAWGGV